MVTVTAGTTSRNGAGVQFVGTTVVTDGAIDTGERAKTTTPERMAELRRRQEEKRRADLDARLAEPVTGTPPEAVNIAANLIRFDRRYQTDDRYDEGRALRIAIRWDWKRYDTITLNMRPDEPGVFYCPDGRHRVNGATMRMGRGVMLPASLHRLPYADEARMFAEQHEEEKRVSDALRFNAMKEAGDEIAVAEQALLDRLNLGLGRKAGFRTLPAKTFLYLYRRHGEATVEAALDLILSGWGEDGAYFEAPLLKGMAEFIGARQGEEHFRIGEARRLLRETSLARVQEQAARQHAGMKDHLRIAAALVDLYNHGRRNRLSPWR